MNSLFITIINLFVISFAGFLLYRKKVISDAGLAVLTKFVINVAVPCLIFTNIINHFDPGRMPSLWIFLFLSFSLFALGATLGIIFSLSRPEIERREFISLLAFQNSGYLPMNIALFLLPSTLQAKFLTYIFLYIFGFNILMWSVGSFLIFRTKKDAFRINSILTPPVTAVLIAIISVYGGYNRLIPSAVVFSAEIIGQTAFILSLIVLGCWLAKTNAQKHITPLFAGKILILKLVVVPLFVFAVVFYIKAYSLLGLLILLEASMPSAASLPIVASLHNSRSEYIAGGVFLTHCVSIITIPFWIWLFIKVSSLPL